MMKYKKELLILSICLIVCVISSIYIKKKFYSTQAITNSAERIISIIKNVKNTKYNDEVRYKEAVTQEVKDEKQENQYRIYTSDDGIIYSESKDTSYPYDIAPIFEDDGSIIYDGMTLTELTDKLNKSLGSYLTNTGYFFADYTRRTGMNPYLSVAIVLLETGCKWSCSTLTKECNNIGGLKGGTSCNGRSYRKYNTLGEGIEGYLDIIYNNYYMRGMKTPVQMQSVYAPGSTMWADQVNSYINEIKAK